MAPLRTLVLDQVIAEKKLLVAQLWPLVLDQVKAEKQYLMAESCLLYTSDAADE